DLVGDQVAEGEEAASFAMMPNWPFEELVLFVNLLDLGIGPNQRIERRIQPFDHILRLRCARYQSRRNEKNGSQRSHGKNLPVRRARIPRARRLSNLSTQKSGKSTQNSPRNRQKIGGRPSENLQHGHSMDRTSWERSNRPLATPKRAAPAPAPDG